MHQIIMPRHFGLQRSNDIIIPKHVEPPRVGLHRITLHYPFTSLYLTIDKGPEGYVNPQSKLLSEFNI